jgi:hypothetical protein
MNTYIVLNDVCPDCGCASLRISYEELEPFNLTEYEAAWVASVAKPEYFLWECRNGIYRASWAGIVAYFAYSEHGSGYGGWTFYVHMLFDDGLRKIIGPWSGRADIVNAVYPDKYPLSSDYDCHMLLGHAVIQQYVNSKKNLDYPF